MPRGKPISREQIAKALGAVAMGADYALAAALIGVSHGSLKNHVSRNARVKREFEEARQRSDSRVVKSLFDKALAGDTTAMIFWLKNRQPTAWRDRRELAGDPKAPLFSGPIRLIVDGDDADDDAAE